VKKLNAPFIYLLAMFITGLTTKVVFTTHVIYRVQVVGMDALQLVLAGTALEVAVFLFEIPTGVVADTYSRRLSVLLGFLISGVAFTIEGMAPLVSLVFASQALWGFGATFISGAFSAWITDEIGIERVGALFLRGRQLTLLGSLVGIPISVLAANSSLALPFFVGGLIRVAFAVFLLLFMPETGFTPVPKSERQGWRSMAATFREGVAVVRRSRVLTTFAFIALFVGLYSEAWDRLGQAHLLESFAFPSIGSLQLDPIAWFGLLNTAFILFSLLSNEVARRFVNTTQSSHLLRALQAIYASMAVLILIFAFSQDFYLSVVAMLLFDAIRSVSFPFVEAWLNLQIASKVRATVLSMAGQLDAFGEIAAGPLLGSIGRLLSTQAALVASALILSPAVPLYQRIRREAKTEAIKEESR
jgi:DHA3 family tetracycline resistance protein-like MFS transporter